MLQKMIATRDMTYRTRRLRAGDSFEARPGVARLFAKAGRARPVDVLVTAQRAVPAAPRTSAVAEAPDVDHVLEALRRAYAVRFGRDADRRWKADRLRRELASALEAPSLYDARDIQTDS